MAASPAYSRAYHASHKTEAAERMRLRRARNRDFVERYKALMGCVDCGEKDPIVLEFDHRDRRSKSFNIGMRILTSLPRLMAEIIKCDVRCANCHRRKTRAKQEYLRVR